MPAVQAPTRGEALRPKLHVDGAIALLRESFLNDGAEGESVHLVCDELEAFRARAEHLEEVLRKVYAQCENNAIWFKTVDLEEELAKL